MKDYLNLEKQYDDIISHVYKDGIHKIQYIEMRRLFFAGVATVVDILIRSSHEDVTDDQLETIFESLRQQVFDFFEKKKRDNVNDNDVNRG